MVVPFLNSTSELMLTTIDRTIQHWETRWGVEITDGDEGATLSSLSISPTSTEVHTAGTAYVAVYGVFDDGSTSLLTNYASWSSTSPSFATVTGGTVTGRATGTTNIYAVYETFTSNTCAVSVVNAALTGITITPASFTMHTATTSALTATGYYEDGWSRSLNSVATWVVGTGSVASITNSVLSGLTTGSTTVKATFASITSNTITVTVEAAAMTGVTMSPSSTNVLTGSTTAVTLIAGFEDATTWPVTNYASYVSNNSAIATISASGVTSGVTTGSTTIYGYYGTFTSSTSTVTVYGSPVTGVTLSSAAATIFTGTNTTLMSYANRQDGSLFDITSNSNWISTATSVATVSAGVVTGVNTGTTAVYSYYGAYTSSTATINVIAATLTGITVYISSTTLAATSKSLMSATSQYNYVNDPRQNILITDAVTWSSYDTSVVDVDADGTKGLISGDTAGSTVVMATYEGITGGTTITVT